MHNQRLIRKYIFMPPKTKSPLNDDDDALNTSKGGMYGFGDDEDKKTDEEKDEENGNGLEDFGGLDQEEDSE